MIHIALLVEQVCQAKGNGFDFLLGSETYKNSWCNEEAEVVNIHAGFHRWAPTYFWFSRGKPLARQHLQMVYLRARAWLQRRRTGGGAQ